MIVYLAFVTMAFGAVLTGIDAMAGLPIYWTFEGPPTIVMGVVILLLVRRINRAASDNSIPESS